MARQKAAELGLTTERAGEEPLRYLMGEKTEFTKWFLMRLCGEKCKGAAKDFLKGILGKEKFGKLGREVKAMLLRQKIELQRQRR